uniref:Interferon (alpha, beta and omega) receptor 2, gene 1 n=1 Tax=Xenopus tropicalis TaxID=8364 RepID=A0A6I8PSQ1_XENTR
LATLSMPINTAFFSFVVLAALRSPENVQIHSANFQHILTWEDNNNNSLVSYRVQYTLWRRRNWSDVSTCANITEQRCDLTDYFTDISADYIARVVSFTHNEISSATTSAKFSPLYSTDLGPPLVNISAQGCNVTVHIRAPISYFKGAPSMLHDRVYPLVTYSIKRWQGNQKLIDFENVTYKEELPYVESNLPPNTNFCVSVNVSASVNTRGKIIPSALKCVVTEETHDFQPPYVIAVVVAILILIGLVCVLFALDRAGYICMSWGFFPRVLKSFPASVSMDRNTEKYDSSAQIAPIEILSNTEQEERSDSDRGMCGQGYAKRNMVLDSAQNDSSEGESSAVSSSVESSGQDCSSAEKGIPKEPLLDLCESVASGSELPQATDTPSPSPMLLNSAGVFFNINLNSVSVGNPEVLGTDCKNQTPPIEEQVDKAAGDAPDVPQGPHDLRLNTNILNLGACRVPVSGEGSSEEAGTSDESDADSGAEETERLFASDYMSR